MKSTILADKTAGNLKKTIDLCAVLLYSNYQREVPVLHVLIHESGTSLFLLKKKTDLIKRQNKSDIIVLNNKEK